MMSERNLSSLITNALTTDGRLQTLNKATSGGETGYQSTAIEFEFSSFVSVVPGQILRPSPTESMYRVYICACTQNHPAFQRAHNLIPSRPSSLVPLEQIRLDRFSFQLYNDNIGHSYFFCLPVSVEFVVALEPQISMSETPPHVFANHRPVICQWRPSTSLPTHKSTYSMDSRLLSRFPIPTWCHWYHPALQTSLHCINDLSISGANRTTISSTSFTSSS
jgi:hypothetical protein